MSELKPYPEYKDSHISWMGKVPKSWKKIKMSWLFTNIGSGGTPSSRNDKYYENGTINRINTGDLNDSYLAGTKNKITENALKEVTTLKVYPENSLIIAMYGATIGKLAITEIEATTNQACCVMYNPLNTSVRFMYYWFLTSREDIINLSSGGGQPNISQSLIRGLNVFLPESLEVQNRIVDFLDNKTFEINTLINEKKRLIDLLEEKRKAIIIETVTKGLDPNAEMRDSGIEWIGEIPKHWEVAKIKRSLRVLNGKEIEVELPSENTEAVDVFGSGGIFKKTDKALYEDESVLFGRKGTIGKPLYVNTPFWTVDTMYFTEFYSNSLPKWFYYMFLTFPWEEHTTQTAIPSLVGTDIENEFCAIPSYNEQKLMANYLDEKMSIINNVIKAVQIQISKLQEYRESLIYEAVTGKIDLRNIELGEGNQSISNYEEVAEENESYQ